MFSVSSASAFVSASVATTRLADLAATMEQIPVQPQPSSNTRFPETMFGFLSRTEAMNRADSHSINPVDLQVCWYSLDKSLILKAESLSLNSLIYEKERWTLLVLDKICETNEITLPHE